MEQPEINELMAMLEDLKKTNPEVAAQAMEKLKPEGAVEPVVATVEKQEGDQTDDEKKKMEEIEKKVQAILKGMDADAEGVTASDSAEEVLEDPLPDSTLAGLDAVEKTLAVLKSKTVMPTGVIKTLGDIANVVKSQGEQIAQLSTGFEAVLKCIGVDKQLELVAKQAEEEEEKKKEETEKEAQMVAKSQAEFVQFWKSLAAEKNITANPNNSVNVGQNIDGNFLKNLNDFTNKKK
jgi:hypothetical protein